MIGPQLHPMAPLPPRAYASRHGGHRPFPLDGSGWRIFRRARQGLYQGVKALGLRSGDEVLVPAYHHGSEVQALLEAGLVCRFYEITEALAPDPDELDALAGPRTRALHLIHYFGFPQDAGRWRAWCDERGLLLLEDAAQAWLSSWRGRPVGSFGDLAIFSVYKTFGVPDGGLVVARRPLTGPAGPGSSGIRAVLGSHLQWLWQQWPLGDGGRQPHADRGYDQVADLALGDPRSAPTRMTVALLSSVEAERTRARRRRNYAVLLARLRDGIRPLFPELPDGAVPFLFPAGSSDKASLLERLERRGVTALDVWSVPHPTLPSSGFARTQALRRCVVGLPVHQELRQRGLERVVEAIVGGG
ncbi:MAG TPA: DegT/DnrJ/EryC1/StrS family aminotransferase [Actinomycetes bacterium]|nr:DegT/DnrJ/EryC1/StrS family aminotransferase [Actinomycetes bacterium]